MPAQMVWIVCDKCGKPSPLGMAMDEVALENEHNSFRGNRSWCQHCGKIVLWRKGELLPETVVIEKFGEGRRYRMLRS